LEKRKGGDSSGDVAGDRQEFELADGARDVAGHVTEVVGLPEDQVVG
jgi:hypothetical protein